MSFYSLVLSLIRVLFFSRWSFYIFSLLFSLYIVCLIVRPFRRHVYIVVDNSNLCIGAKQSKCGITQAINVDVKKAADVWEGKVVPSTRVQRFLSFLSCYSSVIVFRYVGGSYPPRRDTIWRLWRKREYRVQLLERTGSKRETGVDDSMHAQIYRLLHLHSPRQLSLSSCLSLCFTSLRPVLLLVTGDGNLNDGRTSFIECAIDAVNAGWCVEVWTWRLCCSKQFVTLAQKKKKQCKIVYLDDYREDITFVENKE